MCVRACMRACKPARFSIKGQDSISDLSSQQVAKPMMKRSTTMVRGSQANVSVLLRDAHMCCMAASIAVHARVQLRRAAPGAMPPLSVLVLGAPKPICFP